MTVRAVATALVIGAGALLWWERPEPQYPTTQDTATILWAINERTLAMEVESALYPYVETNSVGYYASRQMYRTTIPAKVSYLAGRYVNLWGAGGVTGVSLINGRKYADYRTPISDEEFMRKPWWQTNIYEDATEFGDFEYLHTNVYYLATNILNEIAKPLSAMRWTVQGANNEVIVATNNSTVTWSGSGTNFDSRAEAVAAAIADCQAAEGLLLDDDSVADMGLLTNRMMMSHSVAVLTQAPSYPFKWRAGVTEYASFNKLDEWVPMTTNLTSVYEVGVFQAADNFASVSNIFYHPVAIPDVWEITEAPKVVNGAGMVAYRESLHKWQGRIDMDDVRAWLMDDDNEAGWRTLIADGRSWFVADWRFECLTNRADFWQ